MMQPMSTREKLLEQIEAHIIRSGISASEFGQRAISDRMLVKQMREGRDVTTGTADRIRAFMQSGASNQKKATASESIAA